MSTSASSATLKPLTVRNHDKLGKAPKDMGIPDRLPCLLRNLYAGQEAAVRTPYGTAVCCRVEKGMQWRCLLSPCLFNLYPEHGMRNAGLDELIQAFPDSVEGKSWNQDRQEKATTSDMQMTPL